MKRKNIFYFFIILAIFLFDRISKVWIISISNLENNPDISLLPFINLNLIWNRGIAFGLFSFTEKFGYNLLTGLILFIILKVVIIVI